MSKHLQDCQTCVFTSKLEHEKSLDDNLRWQEHWWQSHCHGCFQNSQRCWSLSHRHFLFYTFRTHSLNSSRNQMTTVPKTTENALVRSTHSIPPLFEGANYYREAVETWEGCSLKEPEAIVIWRLKSLETGSCQSLSISWGLLPLQCEHPFQLIFQLVQQMKTLNQGKWLLSIHTGHLRNLMNHSKNWSDCRIYI